MLVEGDLQVLPALAEAKLTGNRPILFFSAYLKPKEIISLVSKVDLVVLTGSGNLSSILAGANFSRLPEVTFLPLQVKGLRPLGNFNHNEEISKKLVELEKLREKNINIVWKKINPTRYKVSVEIKKKVPFWLVLSETFHPAWIALVRSTYTPNAPEPKWSLKAWWKDRKRIVCFIHDHFLANGFANAWWIDTKKLPDRFDIIIEFKWQRYFEIFLLSICIVIFTGLVVFISKFFINRIR